MTRRESRSYEAWEARFAERSIDPKHRSGETEAWWDWPGMFWAWSTGPIRRLVARMRRA